MMSKKLQESRYTRFNCQGFRILQIYEIWGTYYALAQNDNGEYVWGKNYDLEKGYWQGGVYRYELNKLIPEIYGKLVVDNAGWGKLR